MYSTEDIAHLWKVQTPRGREGGGLDLSKHDGGPDTALVHAGRVQGLPPPFLPFLRMRWMTGWGRGGGKKEAADKQYARLPDGKI